ncbi:F0F1 ATP synthase subunit gamma, partial [Salmonella enterica subsp. enterica serovar Enteritidis]|nr:F0F1 ATP synthase subunit gamma [Salmonella enterica subsp. enterica serovar Enteritidis]
QKAVSFFKNYGGKVLGATTQVGDAPSLEQLSGSVQVMLDAYDKGELDRIYLVSNGFVNAMTQNQKIEQLVPLAAAEEDKTLNRQYGWDYIYEPEAEELLNGLLVRYIESVVYQGVIENIACEQSARMVAMKAATDNAGEIIKSLQLIYNKLRQAAITQEISEIVGGAAAV